MKASLRKAWTEVIVADELDAHLDDLGQAEVNSLMVKNMIKDFQLEANAKVLMPGCGTGQIFDYISVEDFKKYKFTFTDINQSFLDKLDERMNKHKSIDYKCCIDDLENTVLGEEFDAVVCVLVLEQLDWQKGIKAIVDYNPKYIYLIIQEQSDEATTITVNVKSRDSIKQFSKMADPKLVPKQELIDLLKQNAYHLLQTYEQVVPNQKVMVGLIFGKNI